MQPAYNPESGEKINAVAVGSFYNGAERDEIESHKQGRPIYKDKVFIKIIWQGDTKKELHAPADDRSDRPIKLEDNSRFFPKWKDHPDFKPAYEAFLRGQAQSLNGTPIEEAPFLSVAQRMELKAINILTVEGLAEVSAGTRLGSSLADLRRHAQNYLERAKGAAVDAKHEAETRELKDEIATLRQQMDALLSGSAEVRPAAAKAPKAAKKESAAPSVFETLSDDELRGWLTEANGSVPHHKCSRATLITMANDTNARLKAAAEGNAGLVPA